MEINENTLQCCEMCGRLVYDDTDDCWYCDMNIDEDEYARLFSGGQKNCPYYSPRDEYAIVRKQI